MIQNKITIVVLLAFAISNLVFAQGDSFNELEYGINRIYPAVSITKEKLKDVRCLVDINKRYEESWVKTYVSVEVATNQRGKAKRVVSKNDILSQQQLDMIKSADLGSDISVRVKYIPENTLPQNEVQEIDFTFTIDPDKQAEYSGGEQEMIKYLKENAIDKISSTTFGQYQLAAYKFIIDEEGRVTNPRIFWSSEDAKVDELLLETLRNMPKWIPAEHSNGTKVKQEFALTVGDMKSCVANLLKFDQD